MNEKKKVFQNEESLYVLEEIEMKRELDIVNDHILKLYTKNR
jgi:hypothetical protein